MAYGVADDGAMVIVNSGSEV